ncbi:hypothetical protein IG631_21903 [Alternaria alternata]|nr:hypothetical protein IG631_21903 [Alternaria alternata]
MMSNAGAIRVPLYFFRHLDGKRIAGTVLSNTSKIFYTKNLLNFPEPSLGQNSGSSSIKSLLVRSPESLVRRLVRWSVRGVLLRSSGLVQYGQRLEVGDRYREEGPLDRQSGVCSRRARRDDAITVVMHGNDATRTNEQTTEQPGEIRVTRYPSSVFSEQWVYIGKYGTYTDDLIPSYLRPEFPSRVRIVSRDATISQSPMTRVAISPR